MKVEFTCGDDVLSIDASYTPMDSFKGLIDVGLFLLDDIAGDRAVGFNEEPEQIDLCFAVGNGADGVVGIRAVRYRDHRRGISVPSSQVLKGRCRKRDVVAAIALATRNVEAGMGAEAFAREWRRPFPSLDVAQLEMRLASAKGPLRS